MSAINIELDQHDFTGGDEVKGRIVLDLDEAIPARAVRAHFHGYEKAYWVRGLGKNCRPTWETRSLFDQEVTLRGQPPLSTAELLKDAIRGLLSLDNYEMLQAGQHAIPFQFTLPEELPGNYESPRVSTIRYEIRAYVDIPLKVDLSTQKRLAVYESYKRGSLHPVQEEGSKTFSLDKDATLDVELRLERHMFNPGDEVTCTVTLQNNSSKQVDKLQLLLVQVEDLYAQELTHQERFEVPLGEADAPDLSTDEPVQVPISFKIPSDLYASISSSQLVTVSYALVLRVDIAWGGDIVVELPIVLLEQAGMPSGTKLDDQPQ